MPLDLAAHLLSKSHLRNRATPEFTATKIDEVDRVLEGFPQGAISEIYGAPSSGRTALTQAFLAAATAAGQFVALVDGSDAFDPASAGAAGIDLSRLLWVRCRNAEQALKCADLLIHAGGWGAVVLDLAGLDPAIVRRTPLSWWYRFRRAVENTPTVLLVLEREPNVKACASLALEMQPAGPVWSGAHSDFQVLRAAQIKIAPRKPMRSETPRFEARASG